jgi:hypothetical protein
MSPRLSTIAGAALALALAFPAIGRTNDRDTNQKAVQDAIVQFGQPQPQSTPAPVTHILLPDDVTIRKGGTATFVVNGGGHGIAIYPVSRNTTRAGIAAQLCQGDATVCNATAMDPVTGIVGSQNLNYRIVDGKGNLIIVTGTNVAGGPAPQFARVDDPTDRLIATSTQLGSVVGAFLTGTALNTTTNVVTPGNQIAVRLLKTGRYLVICMNRAHSLNDHMFGFVNVVDDDDDDDDDNDDDGGGHEGHN